MFIPDPYILPALYTSEWMMRAVEIAISGYVKAIPEDAVEGVLAYHTIQEVVVACSKAECHVFHKHRSTRSGREVADEGEGVEVTCEQTGIIAGKSTMLDVTGPVLTKRYLLISPLSSVGHCVV